MYALSWRIIPQRQPEGISLLVITLTKCVMGLFKSLNVFIFYILYCKHDSN